MLNVFLWLIIFLSTINKQTTYVGYTARDLKSFLDESVRKFGGIDESVVG